MDDKVAIVLIGGKSSRMGCDKSLLDYYGKPHKDYLLDMLQSLDFTAFLAGRKEQQQGNALFLLDESIECGPVSGILSALRLRDKGSFLALSCDQPLVDAKMISWIWYRSQMVGDSVLMSCFCRQGMPAAVEPFPSVWKAEARPWVEQAVADQHYAIRDILPIDRLALHSCPDYPKLLNINTPRQRQSWREKDALGY